MRVTSRRIARHIADDYALQPSLVQELVKAFLQGCAQAVVDGDEVVLEGLGSLLAKKDKQTSIVTDPDGVKHTRSARVRVRFHRSQVLGKELRRRFLTPKERGK